MVLAHAIQGTVPLALSFHGLHGKADAASAAWLADLAVAGRSAATLRAYLGDVLAFLAWAVARGVTSWARCDHATLAAFIASEHARGVGLRLIARRVSTVRAVLRHARSQGHDVVVPVIRTRQPVDMPATVSAEDIARVIRACRGDDFFAVRDRAALELLYGSGITSREFCALDVDCLDFARLVLRVDSDPQAVRVVPINRAAVESVRAWLVVRRPASRTGSDLAMFVSAQGFRLTPDSLATIVQRRSIAAGVVPILTPRLIRNSYGVHLFDRSADESQVAALMGLSVRRVSELRRATNPNTRSVGPHLRSLTDARERR